MNLRIPQAPTILAALTFLILITHILGDGALGYIGPFTYLIALFYLAFFSASFYISLMFFKSYDQNRPKNVLITYEQSTFSKTIYYSMVAAFITFYINLIGFDFFSFLEFRGNIISLYRADELSLEFRIVNTLSLSVFYFSAYLYLSSKKNELLYAIIALACPLLMANRNYILILFIFFGYKILFVHNNKKQAIYILSIFFALNVFYVYVFEKGDGTMNIFLSTALSILKYLTLPLHGLDYSLRLNVDYGYFLSLPATVVSWLGLYSDRNFLYTPHPNQTNVYTLFFGIIYDFGFIGLIFFSTIAGFFHAYIYQKAQTNSLFLFVCLYSFYPLLMTYFDNTYTTSPGSWIYLLVPFLFLKKVRSLNFDMR